MATRTKPRTAVRARPQPTDKALAWAQRFRDHLILAGTLVLTIGVYAATIGNQFIAFDDPENILDNYSIREFSLENLRHYFTTPLEFMYTPLVSISYAIDYQFGELSPATYHTTNLLLHLACVALVYFVVRALTERPFLAHFCAIAFAIHPVNVDAVAWVATRSGLLATAFMLGSLLAYLRYAARPRWWVLVLSIVLYALATLSKSSAVVLPILLVLVDYFQGRSYLRPLSGGRGWRSLRAVRPVWRPVLDKLPYVAISVVMGLVTLHFRTDTMTPAGYEWYDRVIIICAALVTYVVKLFVPVHLAMAYAYPAKSGGHLAWYLYLAPVVLVAVSVLLYRIRSARRIVVFGLGFFLVTILPAQLVWLIDNYTANRYAYLPYLGLLLIAGHFLARLLTGRSDIRIQAIATGLLAGVVLVFSVISVVRGVTWHDTMRVTTASIDTEPRVAFVYASRGIAEYNARDYPAAQRDFEKTLELDPNYAIGYLYIGRIKHAGGDFAGAIAQYDQAISRVPDFAVAYSDRGKSRSAQKDSVGALSDFSWAIGLDAYLVDAYHQRGIVEIEVGNEQAAVGDFNRVIELMPKYADAFYYRGIARGRLNDVPAACADLRHAQALGLGKAGEALTQVQCPVGA
jgi:protein O-mannosyl-transferase